MNYELYCKHAAAEFAFASQSRTYVHSGSSAGTANMGGETTIFFNSSNARCRSCVHASGTPLRKHLVKGSAIAAYLGIKIRKYLVIPKNPRSSETDRGKGQLATQAVLALSTSMNRYEHVTLTS